MEEKTKQKSKDLKAFLITFTLSTRENDNETKTFVVIAYDKKEAGDLFIKFAKAKDIYNYIDAIVVQRTRKTKKNAHMITKDYYIKQNKFVKCLKKAEA